jgi:hypothetical protein
LFRPSKQPSNQTGHRVRWWPLRRIQRQQVDQPHPVHMRLPLVGFAVCDGARATVRIRPGGGYSPTARVVLIQVEGPTLRIKIENQNPVGLKILKIFVVPLRGASNTSTENHVHLINFPTGTRQGSNPKRMMATKGINVGKGLLRLYLVLWLLLAVASLVGGHREVLTYLGSTYWSAEKVVQRQKEEFQKKMNDCKSEDCRKRLQDSTFTEFPSAVATVDLDEAKRSVELFAYLVLVVPAVLLVVLLTLFKLLAWAFAGFKAH